MFCLSESLYPQSTVYLSCKYATTHLLYPQSNEGWFVPKQYDAGHSAAVGKRIRAKRQWLELSQTDLGERIGVSFQQVQKYENGTDDMCSARLVSIAGVLKTTPNALLGVSDGKRDPSADEAAALFADRSVASILTRLRGMSPAQRKLAHSLVCSVSAQ